MRILSAEMADPAPELSRLDTSALAETGTLLMSDGRFAVMERTSEIINVMMAILSLGMGEISLESLKLDGREQEVLLLKLILEPRYVVMDSELIKLEMMLIQQMVMDEVQHAQLKMDGNVEVKLRQSDGKYLSQVLLLPQ
jgi:hypothetical protein